ncbi:MULTISPECIES: Mov34/MPN/PAD-1 family protein [Bacteroidota]|uniref:Mov34/MPN/PAD-1 family protein n=1 Tax=Bacteroidota TaxID=976 RepID=UPI00329A2315
MILKVEKIGLSIEVGDELLNSLIVKGKSHYPNEFGGFLIGHYSDDQKHLNITNTIFPINFKASKNSFERNTYGIEKKLAAYYIETPKKIYVGEWHTHPDNSPVPSNMDILAVNSITNYPNACLSNPVLLIIGYSKTEVDFGFYVWFENKLNKYA